MLNAERDDKKSEGKEAREQGRRGGGVKSEWPQVVKM